MAWFPFVKRRMPSPGAQAYALASFRATTDSLWGAATNTIQRLRVNQPPQSGQGLNIPLSGLGGPVSGQVLGQPLFDLSTDGFQTPQAFGG